MKRILTMSLLLVMALAMQAKSDVQLVKGSLVGMKDATGTLSITWDYRNSTIEKKGINVFLKEKGPEWQRDYKEEVQRAETTFRKKLDKKLKHLTVVDGKKADYRIVVKVKDFHYGHTALAVTIGLGAGDAFLWGTVEVYKGKSTKPIAVLDVDGVHGGGYGNETRRNTVYNVLANHVVKQIKRAK